VFCYATIADRTVLWSAIARVAFAAAIAEKPARFIRTRVVKRHPEGDWRAAISELAVVKSGRFNVSASGALFGPPITDLRAGRRGGSPLSNRTYLFFAKLSQNVMYVKLHRTFS
jgi:hypothetical protein